MKNQTTDTAQEKPGKGIYVFMGLLACFFAFLVIKEVTLPRGVVAAGAVTGGLLLLLTGISKPEVITYVLVAYLPFSKVLVGDFGTLAMAFNLTNLLMAFIIFVWANGKYSAGEPLWLRTPLNVPIILFMLAGLASLLRGTSYDPQYFWPALVELKRWITPIFLFFLVLNTVKERAMIRNVVIIMMIVTTLVGLMSIYDYRELGQVGSLDQARIGGISDHSNSLAAFFNYYMFLPIGFLLIHLSRPRYWLLVIPFLIQFRGIMVTFSRGGYLAFAVGLYAITFIRSRFLFLLLLFLTAIVIFNPILLPAGIRYRMEQTIEHRPAETESVENLEEDLDASAKTRVEVWKGAVQMIKDHPFFGVGYGLFYSLIPYYWSGARPIDAHNTYLIIAAEMGIPTLLIFFLIILMVFAQTVSLYRRTRDPFAKAVALGFIGGLFGLIVSNMFGSRLDSQEVSGYFWILAALVMRFKILDAQEKNHSHLESLEAVQEIREVRHLDRDWQESPQPVILPEPEA